MRPARAAAAAAVVLAALLVGCVESNRPGDEACHAATIELSWELADGVLDPSDPAVCRGQQVTVTVTSDLDGYLHVHGYDEELPVINVRGGETTDVTFEATRAGQFPIELHTDEQTQGQSLGILTVHEP